MRLIAFAILLWIAVPIPSFGQKCEWGIEVKPKLGYLMEHSSVMGHLPQQHALGGEISLFFNTTGRKAWQEAYKYPKIGVTFFGSTVGNLELLGTQWGAYAFMEFPFVKSERMEFTGKLGCGMAYGTKVFDQELNPKAVAMSTHINALICMGLQYRYFFGKNHIVTGIDLTHCSNGSTKVPNLGINLPYFSIGYGRIIRALPKQKSLEAVIDHNWKFSAIGIFSLKEVFPTGGKKYPVYGFSFFGQKLYNQKTGWEMGVDLIYKTSINTYRTHLVKTKESIAQIGVYSCYVLPLDKFYFVLGMGGYIRDEYFQDNRLYHRLGMRYQVTPHLLINFTLKAHWAKADYVEYGIGYTF
jgi:hypothetical protein